MRRVPSQQRAQERVERILAVATEHIVEHGIDAVRMSELADRAGISIGSLYQYFPDKAAIVGSLAERYNAEGRACVAQELAAVQRPEELRPALIRAAAGFYAMYLRLPAMRAIWQAMQADASLQAIDAADGAAHAGMLADTLARIDPSGDRPRQDLVAALLMNQLAAAVRFAITLDRPAGDTAMRLFEATLPRDILALCSKAGEASG